MAINSNGGGGPHDTIVVKCTVTYTLARNRTRMILHTNRRTH
jgi:hypothetical protein